MTEDMEDNTKLLESLFEKATDYGKTSLELVKLKTVEKNNGCCIFSCATLCFHCTYCFFHVVLKSGNSFMAG